MLLLDLCLLSWQSIYLIKLCISQPAWASSGDTGQVSRGTQDFLRPPGEEERTQVRSEPSVSSLQRQTEVATSHRELSTIHSDRPLPVPDLLGHPSRGHSLTGLLSEWSQNPRTVKPWTHVMTITITVTSAVIKYSGLHPSLNDEESRPLREEVKKGISRMFPRFLF